MAKKSETPVTFFVAGCNDMKEEVTGCASGGTIDGYSFLGMTMKEAQSAISDEGLDQLNCEADDIVYEVTVRPVGKINLGIVPLKK